jgi:hypothetical protein
MGGPRIGWLRIWLLELGGDCSLVLSLKKIEILLGTNSNIN